MTEEARHHRRPQAIGRRAEDLACRHLCARGARLLERNYRARRGEIDLIVHEGGCIVFVEVRYRHDTRFGSAAESIDRRKRERLILTARHYLLTHPQNPEPSARFDVVTVVPDGNGVRIEWIKDAFRA